MTVAVGFAAASERDFHQICSPVFAAVDYLEVVPESLVHPADLDAFRGNHFLDRILDLQQRHGVHIVAHGTGLSLCGAHPLDTPRLKRWIDRAARLTERLDLRWYTDHTSLTAPAGLHLTLPFDTPRTAGALSGARGRLDALGQALGIPVGFENSAVYMPLADPATEPDWIRAMAGDTHVWVLDLHNLWTHAHNFGIDLEAWLNRAPLHRVIEVHVSGGQLADPTWTDGVPWHLDSHDAAVPEPVWTLLEHVLPRLPNVRGVTLERIDGSVRTEDVPHLVAELGRIRSIVQAVADEPQETPLPGPSPPHDAAPLPGTAEQTWQFELALADAFSDPNPAVELQRLHDDPAQPAWVRTALAVALARPAGIGITKRLVVRQRFERLINGSARADRWLEVDPSGFARAFRDYTAAVPPVAFFPWDEADLFERWLTSSHLQLAAL